MGAPVALRCFHSAASGSSVYPSFFCKIERVIVSAYVRHTDYRCLRGLLGHLAPPPPAELSHSVVGPVMLLASNRLPPYPSGQATA